MVDTDLFWFNCKTSNSTNVNHAQIPSFPGTS